MVSRRKRMAGHAQAALTRSSGLTAERHHAWIGYVFDRPVTPNGWYFDLDPRPPRFDATPGEIVDLIAATMLGAGTDLAGFTDAQVGFGLNYIFSNACSDHTRHFGDPEVPAASKVAAIGAMKHLYKNCFEPRCVPRLGHLSETAGHPLNSIAYMLWDTTPIFNIGVPASDVRRAVIDVLEFALCSQNDACIESALHGLGHMRGYEPASVEAAIDRFLSSTQEDPGPQAGRAAPQQRPIRRELRDYAGRARRGMVL